MYVLCKGAPWVSNLSKLQETSQTYFSCVYSTITLLNLVVQKADNTIHWINLFSVDDTIGFPNTGTSRCTYPLDTDLSSERCYSTFWTTGAWCVPFPLFKECYSSFNDFFIFCDALVSQFTRQTFHHCLIIPFLHFKNPKSRHKNIKVC